MSNKLTVASHFAERLDELRLEATTVASYRKNVRLALLATVSLR